jgi:hypothetical protein
MQRARYVTADIDKFKDEYFVQVLGWTWAVICGLWLLLVFINTKSIRNSILSFLYVSLMTACLLFIFKDVILSGTLFINKLYKRDSTQKEYVVIHVDRDKQRATSLQLIDLQTQKLVFDDKFREKLNRPELKPNDTLRIAVDIGLFGIAFPSE